MNASYKAMHEQYVVWLDTLGFASGSIRRYSACARDFFEWLDTRSITEINRVTQKNIIDFFDWQEIRPNKKYKGTTLSASHLNDYYTATDKLLEFLHQMGADGVPSPLNRRIIVDEAERIRKIDPFTVEEIKTLQALIDETYPASGYRLRQLKHYQLKLIFALFYGCGLRLSEGLNLTAKEIDFNRRTVFVRQGKNYKDRIVPMSENVYNALQDYIYNFRHQTKCGHDRLFVQDPVTLLKDLHRLHSLCSDESIRSKRLYFHILRHSIATHLLQNGMTVENIARFLGHSTLCSTQIYTHIINR